MKTQEAINIEPKSLSSVGHPAFANHPHSKLLNEALLVFKDETKIHCPEKYFAAQKSMIRTDIKDLHKTHPEMPVRAAVVHILQDLPDFLPPENILDVTRLIVEEWTKLSQPQPAEIASSVT